MIDCKHTSSSRRDAVDEGFGLFVANEAKSNT
jgi:hypothetical protein